MENSDMSLRYNFNPATKQTTGRTAPITRVDFLGIAQQLGLTPFAGDVCTYENTGSTRFDGVNLQVEKRLADNWAADSVRVGQRPWRYRRPAHRGQRFSGARPAQPRIERGADQPGSPAHGVAERARRGAVDSRAHRQRRRPHYQRQPVHSFTTRTSTPTATTSATIPWRQAPTAASVRTR